MRSFSCKSLNWSSYVMKETVINLLRWHLICWVLCVVSSTYLFVDFESLRWDNMIAIKWSCKNWCQTMLNINSVTLTYSDTLFQSHHTHTHFFWMMKRCEINWITVWDFYRISFDIEIDFFIFSFYFISLLSTLLQFIKLFLNIGIYSLNLT